MNKIAIIVIAIVIVAGGAWLLVTSSGVETKTDTAFATSAWISVESDRVMELVNEGGAEGKVLKSGDVVSAGMILKTDASGAGSINFADGSTIRIEPNSTLKITEGSYNEDTGDLEVRVALLSGKVWSKITALATPESHWEVKTATAVATVRGSAFGAEITDEGTLIVGSEHDIAVAPLNEQGEVITEEEVIVGEEDVAEIGKDRKVAKERRERREELKAWIEQNELRDLKIREQIIELKNQGFEGKELREQVREYVKEEVENEEEETRESEETTKEEPALDTRETTIKTETETNDDNPSRTETNTSTGGGSSSERPVVKAIAVKTRSPLNVSEGTSMNFEAVATLSDGTTKVITDMVDWQVVGSIGKMSSPGIFQASLGADVSEIGTAFGAVTATLGTESGTILGKSEIITVTGAVVSEEDLRG